MLTIHRLIAYIIDSSRILRTHVYIRCRNRLVSGFETYARKLNFLIINGSQRNLFNFDDLKSNIYTNNLACKLLQHWARKPEDLIQADVFLVYFTLLSSIQRIFYFYVFLGFYGILLKMVHKCWLGIWYLLSRDATWTIMIYFDHTISNYWLVMHQSR